jgi:hypothetical protein
MMAQDYCGLFENADKITVERSVIVVAFVKLFNNEHRLCTAPLTHSH